MPAQKLLTPPGGTRTMGVLVYLSEVIMNKLLALAALSLSPALAAPATTISTDFFRPSVATVEDRCKKAQVTAANTSLTPATRRAQQAREGGGTTTLFDDGEGGVKVELQSVAASAYVVCAGRTTRLEDIPSAEEVLSFSPVVVFIDGTVPELERAETWRATLVVIGPDGKELGRLTPSSTSVVEYGYWKQNCRLNRCTWVGRNVYRFLPEAPFNAALPAGSKVRVLASFGQGVQQFDLQVK